MESLNMWYEIQERCPLDSYFVSQKKFLFSLQWKGASSPIKSTFESVLSSCQRGTWKFHQDELAHCFEEAEEGCGSADEQFWEIRLILAVRIWLPCLKQKESLKTYSKWVVIGIFLFFVDVSGIKPSPLLSSSWNWKAAQTPFSPAKPKY